MGGRITVWRDCRGRKSWRKKGKSWEEKLPHGGTVVGGILNVGGMMRVNFI